MTSSENTNYELHLFLGRVEGKLDAVITATASVSARVDKVEAGLAARLDRIEAGVGQRLDRSDSARQELAERLSVLEVRRVTVKDWWALLISICTACAVIYSNTKGLLH